MEAILAGALKGAIVGAAAGLVGGLAVLVLGLLQKPKPCPECGALLPKTRMPANGRQLLWGGGTCPKCGCEVDRRGRKVER